MVKRVKMAEERAKIEEARNVDAVASSRAQAEMMGGLCEELKQLEQVCDSHGSVNMRMD